MRISISLIIFINAFAYVYERFGLIQLEKVNLLRILWNDKAKWLIDCLHVIGMILRFLSPTTIIGILLVPILTSFLNIHVNHILADKFDTNESIIYLLIMKTILDYLTSIIARKFTWRISKIMGHKFISRLQMAKLKCGIPIPGVNHTQYYDLVVNQYKLQQFLFVVPFIWSSFITYTISIYMIETSNEYWIRTIITIFYAIGFCLMAYMNDNTIYEPKKPDGVSITEFTNADMVNMKLSMGYKMDVEYEIKKKQKQEDQQNFQDYIICLFNFVIMITSIFTGNVNQIYSFGSVSWMLGCLSDSIKDFQYKDYVKDFVDLCKIFEAYEYHSVNNMNNSFDSVSFVEASFGYYNGDLKLNPKYITKIWNLSFKFNLGTLYYLEANNGIGKSTLMKMFKSNLHQGKVYFGTTDRRDISFEDVSQSIFYVPQASEFTPTFTSQELSFYRGKDQWLEQKLGLDNFWGKHLMELSGGQKKRMIIYIALTSKAPIILLDETLSELSTEETSEVKESGGWLSRVINTLISWKGRRNKIVLLVGHGLMKMINGRNIVKLGFLNNDNQTELIKLP